MSEYSCDRCGNETENGAGHYLEQLGSDDRVCADCFDKAEAEFRLLVVNTELAEPCIHCSRQVFPTVNGWAEWRKFDGWIVRAQ